MKLYVCIYDDARLLPHFLRHYAQFGITEFHVAAPDRLADDAGKMVKDYLVRLHRALDVADSFTGGVSAVTAMRLATQGPDEWAVIADLDEFVEFGAPAADYARQAEATGCNIMRGIMFDRFAFDGQPKPLGENSDLAALFPVKARFVKNLMLGEDIKGVLVKGHLRSRGAHHIFHEERPAPQVFEISHYKWIEGALDRVRAARAILSAQGIGWAVQYQRILDHYDTNGRFAWETFGGELAGK